jgi:hypothetical protein
MIRTAIPFGYLFIALLLLITFGFGVVSFIWGCRKHSSQAKWLGVGIILLVSALVAVEIAFDSSLEWNPTIHSDTEIVGTWTDHRETLTLVPNNTFDYRTATRTVSGSWTRNDWNLYLHNTDFSATMRFIQFRGRYRLMAHPPSDPDMWDGDLGLSRNPEPRD